MRARLPVLLVLVCLATVLTVAQERGVIVVNVKDSSGAAVPGATVMIARAESQMEFRKCVADQRGVCSFVGVPSGTYRVQAELSGFRMSLQLVNLNAGQTLRVSALLQVAGIEESVTVTGASPIIDTSRAMVVATTPPPPVAAPAPMAPPAPRALGAEAGQVIGGAGYG